MRPIARSFDYTPVGGGVWWIACARFPTARAGERAFTRLLDQTARGELGLYRHGTPAEGGVLVSAVSINRGQVERVARRLGRLAGVDEELDPALVEGMIMRRARIVVEHAAAGGRAGRTRIRHAGQGARLDPSGEMHESGGGQG